MSSNSIHCILKKYVNLKNSIDILILWTSIIMLSRSKKHITLHENNIIICYGKCIQISILQYTKIK